MKIKNKELVPGLPGVVVDLTAEEATLLCEYFFGKRIHGIDTNESRARCAAEWRKLAATAHRADAGARAATASTAAWKIVEKLSLLGY